MKIVFLTINPHFITLISDTGQSVFVQKESSEYEILSELALKHLAEEKNNYLEYDPMSHSIDFFNCNGVKVNYEGQITINDSVPNFNTKYLVKYAKYLKKHPKNAEGFTKLILRLNELSEKESAKVEDILLFLSKNNLPITKTGDILGFKYLSKTSEEGVYVDSYTKLIKQSLLTRVKMNPDLVDRDREVHCSSGLHVATFDYVGPMINDPDIVTCLVLVKPEDIISVPTDTSFKVRTCSYLLLDALPVEELNAYRDKNLDACPTINKLINYYKDKDTMPEPVKEVYCSKATITSEGDCTYTNTDTEPVEKDLSQVDSTLDPVSEETLKEDTDCFKRIKLSTLVKNKQYTPEMFALIKELKPRHTWKELGIDVNMRRNIMRRMNKEED